MIGATDSVNGRISIICITLDSVCLREVFDIQSSLCLVFSHHCVWYSVITVFGIQSSLCLVFSHHCVSSIRPFVQLLTCTPGGSNWPKNPVL
jgi:hypothetical protein